MAKFLFLLRGGSTELKEYSPEDLQNLLEKYDAWVEGLQKSQIFRGAQKLQDEAGRLVAKKSGQTVIDGPFAETKETIGGYFVVEVANYDAAVKEAATCPILSHGGSVEVREMVEGACRYSDN